MKIYENFFLCFLLLSSSFLFSQDNSSCDILIPVCSDEGLNFEANGGNALDAEAINPGNNYDCLGSSPNPSWYFFEIATSGDLFLELSAGADIDYVLYGPFQNVQTAIANCDSYSASDVVSCSYSAANTEYPNILNASLGEVYVLLITNFASVQQQVTLSQTNLGSAGAGETNCETLTECIIYTVTSNFTDCAINGTYNVSGEIEFLNSPSTGSLVVKNCSDDSVVYDAPFESPLSYSIEEIFGDGSNGCKVTAYFTDDQNCIYSSENFNAPLCNIECIIQSVDNSISVCDSSTMTFSSTGQVEFFNPPPTGHLVVKNCSGDSSLYSPPFVSPLYYSIDNIFGDGTLNCSVLAYFTDSLCELSSSLYDEPTCVSNCSLKNISVNLSFCDSSDYTYDISGNLIFEDAPPVGELIVRHSCSFDSTIYYPPFESPFSYEIEGIYGDGDVNCSVFAYFTEPDSCYIYSDSFNERRCIPPCKLNEFSFEFDSCGNNDLFYSGELTFNYPPAIGQLIIEDCHGIKEIFNYPFISPIEYRLDSIPADGKDCFLRAYFTDDLSCSADLNFIPYEFPIPSFYWLPEDPTVFNTDVKIINRSVNAISYEWKLEDGGILNLFDTKDISYSFDLFESGDYPISLKLTNVMGCETSLYDTIIVENPLHMYVPTGFKPFGKNNEFKPVINGDILSNSDYLLEIFDRWGKIIFKTTDINKGWNGMINGDGEICSLGVYVWKISVKEAGEKKPYKFMGNITLLR